MRGSGLGGPRGRRREQGHAPAIEFAAADEFTRAVEFVDAGGRPRVAMPAAGPLRRQDCRTISGAASWGCHCRCGRRDGRVATVVDKDTTARRARPAWPARGRQRTEATLAGRPRRCSASAGKSGRRTRRPTAGGHGGAGQPPAGRGVAATGSDCRPQS